MRIFFLILMLAFCSEAVAVPMMDVSEEGMTLWQLLKTGGWVMVVIGALSVYALALVMYFFITVRRSAFVNPKLLVEVRNALEKGEFEKVKGMCKDRDSFLTRIVYAGVFSRKEGPQVTRTKMEEEGRRIVELNWNRIGYLSDIGVIAPMLGFLGTVTGMIQCFNAVAFKIGEVKPIYMAYGVSQAMITTAAGLILGIPAMMFYFFFRGRIQSIAMKAEPVIDSIADYLKKG